MPLKILYFDLGNVLLHFSHERMCRQMAQVCDTTAERVWQVLFDDGLELRYEKGEVTSQQFYEQFCRRIDRRPDFDALERAASEIFELNVPLAAVVAQLRAAGYRLGLLSNTNESHIRYFTDGRYGLLPRTFDVLAYSCRLQAIKPEPAIYQAAAELAGVAPEEMFFVDDIPGHVAGAREAGIDAVQYTTTSQLVADLRARGLRFNY